MSEGRTLGPEWSWNCPECGTRVTSARIIIPDSLGAAWDEAEAALLPGETMDLESHVDHGRYLAWTMRHSDGAIIRGEGPTPSATLRVFVTKLREVKL